MLKKKKTNLSQVIKAIQIYSSMAITRVEVELEDSLLIADKLNLYAYDAYMISCAIKHHCSLVTLDKGLITAAKNFGVQIVEIDQ